MALTKSSSPPAKSSSSSTSSANNCKSSFNGNLFSIVIPHTPLPFYAWVAKFYINYVGLRPYRRNITTLIVPNVRVNVNIYLLLCMYFRVLIVVKLEHNIPKTQKEGGYVSSVVESIFNLPLFFGSCFNSSVFKTIFSILYLSL